MEELEKLISKLREARQTPGINSAITALVGIRSQYAKAMAELKIQELEDRKEIEITSGEQEIINDPLFKDINVDQGELVEAVESVRSTLE